MFLDEQNCIKEVCLIPTKAKHQRLSKYLNQNEILISLVFTSKFLQLVSDVFVSSYQNFSLEYCCLLAPGIVELVDQVSS